MKIQAFFRSSGSFSPWFQAALGALALFVAQASFADPKWVLYQRSLRSSKITGGIHPIQFPSKNMAGSLSPFVPAEETGKFDQLIDHFDAANTNRFKQRYFLDSTYAKGKDSPIVYYICGEATCDGIDSPLAQELASQHHAYQVALEHRYYGYSQPFTTLDSANLKFLSMDQAIEDLASFARHLRDDEGMSGKWIVMGGSYAGSLSAFYRLKHPELVSGSLASSAPVKSKADFLEYDRQVAKVAGPACLQAIQAVVAQVERELSTPESAEKVKGLFHASDVKDNTDFLYVLADEAAIAIQYGYQDTFCDALTKGMASGTAEAAYASVGLSMLGVFGETPVQDSFQGAESTNPNDYVETVGARQWMYQSCTEFGFYQVANPDTAHSSRSSQITLQYHNNVCKRLFGIEKPVDTTATNEKFYLPLFDAATKNIFFTNGGNDPWSNLSILSTSVEATTNPSLSFFTIDGSAHCDDLGSRTSDALTTARGMFNQLVAAWLN